MSGCQSIITFCPDAHDNANGEIIFSASLDIIMVNLALWRLNSLQRRTDSTAAIPPETMTRTLLPSKLELRISTPVSFVTHLAEGEH